MDDETATSNLAYEERAEQNQKQEGEVKSQRLQWLQCHLHTRASDHSFGKCTSQNWEVGLELFGIYHYGNLCCKWLMQTMMTDDKYKVSLLEDFTIIN